MHLQVYQPPGTVPDGDHTLDAIFHRFAQFNGLHTGIFAEIQLPLMQRVAEIPHRRVSRDALRSLFLPLFRRVHRQQLPVRGCKVPDCLGELLGQVRARNGRDGIILKRILRAFRHKLSQHHLRVIQKILIERKAVLALAGPHPLRFFHRGPIPLLQKNNIRHHFCPRIGLEGTVGQADGTQQVGPLGQILPHGGVFRVHCVAAGDKSHDAARPYLVQGFGKEIVVDTEFQLIVGRVIDRVIAKGDVAHGQIIEVPPVGLFKTGYGNIRFLIQLPGNPPG